MLETLLIKCLKLANLSGWLGHHSPPVSKMCAHIFDDVGYKSATILAEYMQMCCSDTTEKVLLKITKVKLVLGCRLIQM